MRNWQKKNLIAISILFIVLSGCQKSSSQYSSSNGFYQQDRSIFQKKDNIFIGTLYYRPPSPRPEDWDRDLNRMKESGIDVIRVWVYWGKVNPRPGEWEWSDYDQLFDLAKKNGIRILIQYIPEAAPYWFEAKYPEARYIDINNHPMEFHAVPAMAIGGFPGPCCHHPQAKKAVEEFLTRVTERYGQREELYGYDVWNETWVPECYCSFTQAVYQGWLKERYKNISLINQKYIRSYKDFSEIRIPKSKNYVDMFDYMEFYQWVHEDHLRWLVETVHQTDPDHPIVTHWIGSQPHISRADAWGLAALVDKWGTSCYVGDGPSGYTPDAFRDIALQLNTIRDSAQGKPWWIAEMPGGSVWSHLGHSKRSPEEICLKMILGLSFGAEALIFWQWRPEIFGWESHNFGLTGLEGELTPRTEIVSRISKALQSHGGVLNQLEWSQARVGLVWDFRGAMFERDEPPERRVGWRNFRGFYHALFDKGYEVEILNSRLMAESGIPSDIKVIFAPFLMFNREGLSDKLKSWVTKGGTLVAGPRFLSYDANTYAAKQVPPAEIEDVFGVKLLETEYPELPEILMHRQFFSIGPDNVRGNLLMEIYEVRDTKVIGTWEGKPVLTAKTLGKGQGMMCGTFLGVNYSASQLPELGQLIDSICRSAGIIPDVQIDKGCFARLGRSGKDLIIFLINPAGESKEVELSLFDKGNYLVSDLLSEEKAGSILQGEPLRIKLGAKNSRILLFKAF
jgi:beta-galactosidase GanA